MQRSPKMYPNGYPREGGRDTCWNVNDMLGAICIIDNKHEGRPHFGPDGTGAYRQWTNSSSPFVALALLSSSASGS